MNTQLQILKNNINISGLIFDELDLVLEPALQRVVDDSANPFDNILKAAVYPALRLELKKAVEEKIAAFFKENG